jgi:hypothetical protein
MSVPSPGPDTVRLTPPDASEVQVTASGIASAVAGPDGLTAIQRTLIEARP